MDLAGPLSGWQLDLTFSSTVASVESPMAEVEGEGRSWSLNNKEYDGEVRAMMEELEVREGWM